jgi:hypothetical protein
MRPRAIHVPDPGSAAEDFRLTLRGMMRFYGQDARADMFSKKGGSAKRRRACGDSRLDRT